MEAVTPANLDQRLSLFRLLVEQANVVAAARRDTSRFFLTFNTAALGGLGFALSNELDFPPAILLGAAIGMALVSLLWLQLLRYYGRIVSAKFQIIMEVEKGFDVQPYAMEEAKVWKGRVATVGATVLEAAIPLLFLIGYLAIAAYMISQFSWR